MFSKSRRSLYGSLTICLILACCILGVRARAVYSGLTVHEWGTFTSVAGDEGQAVEWSPLTGSTDLPVFVEHFRDAAFKLGLRGTVRMETPVLYFYSARQQSVSAKVSFSKGVITEWYPHASRVEPAAALYDGSVMQSHADGSIAWDSVTLEPSLAADFPKDARDNPYYAARQTTSTPLRVRTSTGEQYEKFLFYRGVSAFPVPVAAVVDGESGPKSASIGKIRVENRGADVIPDIVLFERRGKTVGYRIGGEVRREITFDPPELTSSVDSVARDLEGILVAQGLFQNEAHAMVETWRDSWFEEGSRLLYIVPRKFVDTILPLTVNPLPEKTVRVFVGRLELITPSTRRAIQQAISSHDDSTLQKYGRFLEPILNTIIRKEPDKAQVEKLRAQLNVVYNSQIQRNLARR